MPLGYYIYYRVRPERTDQAREAVLSAQASLRAETGIAGRLLRRADDALTWMEVYESVDDPPGFEAALERQLALHDFAACIAADSRRHIERFAPL